MSSVAQQVLAALAASQSALAASQGILTEAFAATFGGGKAPTNDGKSSTAKATKPPKPSKSSAKAAKAEDKAAARAAMREQYGPNWHLTYTLHPVTLEPRLRVGAVEPKAQRKPDTAATNAKRQRKAAGKLAEKLAEKQAQA